ncbi:hypothetical protein BD408DRAFT_437362 [Parasitella parasitica]|nr:hypothetical protein BD408DRAFT_437362 [Parasitella parasitica]
MKGNVAVLTGASRGIRKAAADALVENGGKVVIGDLLGQEDIRILVRAREKVAVFIRSDATKYEDNKNLFQSAEREFGGVDYALINAGIGQNANSMFSSLDDQIEEKIFNINTIDVIKGTKVALLHMATRGGGSIVHIASAAGFFLARRNGFASYNASKHGVVGYTRSFQFMPYICNVRVNALCPYCVETDLLSGIKESDNTQEPFYNVIKHSPRVSMETVVDGFLTLLTDRTRNTETLLATPEGIITIEALQQPDSFHTKESNAAFRKYIKDVIPAGRAQLAAALKRYESSYSKL